MWFFLFIKSYIFLKKIEHEQIIKTKQDLWHNLNCFYWFLLFMYIYSNIFDLVESNKYLSWQRIRAKVKTMGGSGTVSQSERSHSWHIKYYSGWLKKANHLFAFFITHQSKRVAARDSYFSYPLLLYFYFKVMINKKLRILIQKIK